MASGNIDHYQRAVAIRAKEIAWAKASIEEKFVEATVEARRLWREHSIGGRPSKKEIRHER